MQRNAGFTLIELLVVIAILGILASIVLSTFSSARDKGSNANIQAHLSSMRSEASVYSSDQNPNTFVDVCNADEPYKIGNQLAGACSAATGNTVDPACKCFDGEDSWVASIPLENSDEDPEEAYCVDSTGFSDSISQERYDALSDASTLCRP